MVPGNNTHDICLPATGTSFTRHNISSVISNKELTLRLNPVSPDTDAGVYKCKHRSESACLTLEASGRFPLTCSHGVGYEFVFFLVLIRNIELFIKQWTNYL